MENELRRCWRDTTFRQSNNLNESDRRHTALQRLALHYKRFSNLALVFIGLFPLTFVNLMHRDYEMPVTPAIILMVLSAAYFLTCSLMDRWLYRGILSIDLAEMPVAEVCRRALYYRKKHLQFIAILIPFAVIFLGGMAWLLSYEVYFLWGMGIGAVLGLILGLHQFRLFMKEYHDVMDD